MVPNEEWERFLTKLSDKFGVRLFYNCTPCESYLESDRIYQFPINDCTLTDQRKREIRDWCEEEGWLFSRQKIKDKGSSNQVEPIRIARIEKVEIDIGYHVTRAAVFEAIQIQGILPSNSERQSSCLNRLDCDGNIYMCERLGDLSDAENQRKGSAHWWRDNFSRNNRFNDPNWIILEVNAVGLRLRCYRDICSKTGIIVRGIDAIPPDRLCLLYPNQNLNFD